MILVAANIASSSSDALAESSTASATGNRETAWGCSVADECTASKKQPWGALSVWQTRHDLQLSGCHSGIQCQVAVCYSTMPLRSNSSNRSSSSSTFRSAVGLLRDIQCSASRHQVCSGVAAVISALRGLSTQEIRSP